MVVHDGDILGKPGTVDEARRMLLRLRGNSHEVYTGLAVIDAATARYMLDSETTTVS